METTIHFSELNDFIFCPASLYFHSFYQDRESESFQTTDQILGSAAHESIDEGRFSNRKEVLLALPVYSERYQISGKIDLYDIQKKRLVERKRMIKKVYDGYVFQLYGQYFGLIEMGYEVKELQLYSYLDHKSYPIPLPGESSLWLRKFERLLQDMRSFSFNDFRQGNTEKCKNCIYRPACSFTTEDS